MDASKDRFNSAQGRLAFRLNRDRRNLRVRVLDWNSVTAIFVDESLAVGQERFHVFELPARKVPVRFFALGRRRYNQRNVPVTGAGGSCASMDQLKVLR